MGRHTNALLPGCRPSAWQVMRAEASIRAFSAIINLGLPVEPLVNTGTVG